MISGVLPGVLEKIFILSEIIFCHFVYNFYHFRGNFYPFLSDVFYLYFIYDFYHLSVISIILSTVYFG